MLHVFYKQFKKKLLYLELIIEILFLLLNFF